MSAIFEKSNNFNFDRHFSFFKKSDELYAPTTEPPKSPTITEGEKPQPMPLCYYNLLAGRAQRAAGTSSSSPEQAPAAGRPQNIKMKTQFFFISTIFQLILYVNVIILFFLFSSLLTHPHSCRTR